MVKEPVLLLRVIKVQNQTIILIVKVCLMLKKMFNWRIFQLRELLRGINIIILIVTFLRLELYTEKL